MRVERTCPGCGASQSVEKELHTYYCQYCGRKVTMTPDYSISHIEEKIDHAKMMEAENHRKEIEYRHKEEMERHKAQWKRKLLFPVIWAVGVFLLFSTSKRGDYDIKPLLAVITFLVGLPFAIYCLVRK